MKIPQLVEAVAKTRGGIVTDSPPEGNATKIVQMIIWVLYDIKNDSARNYVAKACKHAGLYRVQYSCFLGTLNENEKDSLELQIEKVIDEESDKIYIFRMNKEQLKSCTIMGQAFD